MGRNIPSGNFPGGFSRGRLIGGNFPGGNILRGDFPRTLSFNLDNESSFFFWRRRREKNGWEWHIADVNNNNRSISKFDFWTQPSNKNNIRKDDIIN